MLQSIENHPIRKDLKILEPLNKRLSILLLSS